MTHNLTSMDVRLPRWVRPCGPGTGGTAKVVRKRAKWKLPRRRARLSWKKPQHTGGKPPLAMPR